MNTRVFEEAMIRAQIFEIAVMAILTMLSIWISYLVIKNAIRDGIRESGLLEILRRRERAKAGSDLPEMRAD